MVELCEVNTQPLALTYKALVCWVLVVGGKETIIVLLVKLPPQLASLGARGDPTNRGKAGEFSVELVEFLSLVLFQLVKRIVSPFGFVVVTVDCVQKL